MSSWLRVWREMDLEELKKHLLVVGDSMGDCASCREIGLDYKTVKSCPSCKIDFKYVTSRRFESNPGERFQIVKRLIQTRSDLTWVDYDDYKKLTGRQRAQEFFSD
jgi:hypothetical protein